MCVFILNLHLLTMENVYYNTYTISDSDDSVIIDGRPQRYKDLIMSPEEPEFFRQVIQQQKRVRDL